VAGFTTTVMPKLNLSDDEINDVVAYIRSLGDGAG
jgi:hypothetical protein